VIFAAVTSALEVEDDLDNVFTEVVRTAAEEGLKELIKQRFGEFWEEALDATNDIVHKGHYAEGCKHLAKALKDLAENIRGSLQKGHLLRELVLKITRNLRKRGITLKNEKDKVLRIATRISESAAKAAATIVMVMESAWFVAAQVLLTPARVESDSEDIYLEMNDLGRRLVEKHDEIGTPPELPRPDPRDKRHVKRGQATLKPGPALPPLR
jgi:hypothetical protein